MSGGAGPVLHRAILCRDCLCRSPCDSARCSSCGSPRTVDLEAAVGLDVAHVDCDAFYASVEKRDDPALKDKPLIIGGSGPRGVVATCCYLARTYGVRSAMPMARARRLCPGAVILPPDMAKYARVGREIRALMQGLTPLVEPLSIDEAFLDLCGCEGANGADAAETLARFAHRIEREVGVTVSVGLSYCKFLAKMASDLDKPRGFAILRREEAKAWLAPQGVGRLWGVGKAGQKRLEKLGFRLIGDLQRVDEGIAAARLGDDGRRLWRLAQGIDDRRVSPDREMKSISSETTFDADVRDREELTRVLLGHCDRVAVRLRRANLAAGGVTLKLRLPDFSLRTRSRVGLRPTQLAPRLFAAARALLEAQPDGAAYRLIGVAATDLGPASTADDADLLDADSGREKMREAAIAALRDRFGAGAVERGLAFRAARPKR
jgi:DNA polymerase-4